MQESQFCDEVRQDLSQEELADPLACRRDVTIPKHQYFESAVFVAILDLDKRWVLPAEQQRYRDIAKGTRKNNFTYWG